jgi:hypothetical protein
MEINGPPAHLLLAIAKREAEKKLAELEAANAERIVALETATKEKLEELEATNAERAAALEAATKEKLAAVEARLAPTESEAKPLYRQTIDELIDKYGRQRPRSVQTKEMLGSWRTLHPKAEDSVFWRALRELGWTAGRRKKAASPRLLARRASTCQ